MRACGPWRSPVPTRLTSHPFIKISGGQFPASCVPIFIRRFVDSLISRENVMTTHLTGIELVQYHNVGVTDQHRFGEASDMPNKLPTDLTDFELVDLLALCIETPGNQEAWAELLRRVLPRIRYFVRGTLQRMIGRALTSHSSVLASGLDETDLCQEII